MRVCGVIHATFDVGSLISLPDGAIVAYINDSRVYKECVSGGGLTIWYCEDGKTYSSDSNECRYRIENRIAQESFDVRVLAIQTDGSEAVEKVFDRFGTEPAEAYIEAQLNSQVLTSEEP